jgi:hypothetical protein
VSDSFWLFTSEDSAANLLATIPFVCLSMLRHHECNSATEKQDCVRVLQRKSCNKCGSKNVMIKTTICNRYALAPKSTLQVLSSDPCNCNLPLVLLLWFRWIRNNYDVAVMAGRHTLAEWYLFGGCNVLVGTTFTTGLLLFPLLL